MRNTLKLSADSLENWQLEVLTTLADQTKRLGIAFFIIGATARDLIMNGADGAPIDRATWDVDFAVCVESWAQYEKLKQSLVNTGYSQDIRKQQHCRKDGDTRPLHYIQRPDLKIFKYLMTNAIHIYILTVKQLKPIGLSK